jgi:hypothetical protein
MLKQADMLVHDELALVDDVIIRLETGLPQKFCVRKDGYFFCMIKNATVYLHRALWILNNGPIPAEKQIDHIDGDPSNNVIDNLRICTKAENCQNVRIRKDNTSGVKGVFWDKSSQSWRASVWKDKKKCDLGRFKSLDEAKLCMEAARSVVHGNFANHGYRHQGVA